MSIGSFVDKLIHSDRMCPYCGHVQSKKPTRRKKCEACGEFFRVLSHPVTKKISLVTEETAIKYQEMREQLAVDRDAARMAEAESIHTEWLKRFRSDLKRMHDTFPFVQISAESENVCDRCRGHDGQVYKYNKMPDLPISDCTCPGGCRCMAVMITAEDAKRIA